MEAREEKVHKEKPNPKPRTRKNINSITKQDNTTTKFQYETTRNKEQNIYKKEYNAVKFREGESSEDYNADDDDKYDPYFLQSKRVKENDETNGASSNEDEEEPEVTYCEEEIKNVRPSPRRNFKDKVLFHSPLRTKYSDKIEEIEAKATATLETFKNNTLTKASYQSYKKLLMHTRGELRVMKPKNKKQRNKLENAVQFTESVMKELDDEFKKLYVTSQISSKNK